MAGTRLTCLPKNGLPQSPGRKRMLRQAPVDRIATLPRSPAGFTTPAFEDQSLFMLVQSLAAVFENWPGQIRQPDSLFAVFVEIRGIEPLQKCLVEGWPF